MKNWLIALALPILALAGPASARVSELDRIVAVVNNDVIVQSELDRKVQSLLLKLRRNGTRAPAPEHLRRQVLERLIFDRLQLQRAKETGIRVPDELLNATVRRIAARNRLTVAEFKDIMEKDGYDFGSFREEIRRELLIARVRERQVENRIRVTDREIQDLLKTLARQGGVDQEYHLGHILISVPEAASPEQIAERRAKAQSIVDQLNQGADFGEIALSSSAGRQALEGGDLGWRKASQLPTLFADVVAGMKPGEISRPLRSPSGFHIVKLIETRHTQKHMVRQTHARHILIRPDELTSSDDAKTRLEQLKLRIEGGDDFATLARANSQDNASAIKGGELGWLNPGDVVPQFEAVMDRLSPGQVSEPFRTPFGWHIVQVLERREHDSTDEARIAKARAIIRKRKIEEETQAWLRRLRDEGYVEYVGTQE